MNLGELRLQYLDKSPYPFDETIREGIFTSGEQTAINKYGYCFEAIWSGKVPLITDKLIQASKVRPLTGALDLTVDVVLDMLAEDPKGVVNEVV